MKVLVVLLFLCAGGFAELISEGDEVEYLIKKFVKGNLSESEYKSFEDLIEVLHRQQRLSAKALFPYGEARMPLTAQLGIFSGAPYSPITILGLIKSIMEVVFINDHDTKIMVLDRGAIDCVLCRSVFAAGFEAITEGQTLEEITTAISTLCTVIGIETYAVCEGAVRLNLPIIKYIVQNQPAATPGTICGFVLQSGHVPNNARCPINDDRFDWVVELPPVSTVTPVVRHEAPVTVAILTDFHIDPLYEPYGQADCDEPTCCRIGQRPRSWESGVFDEAPILNQTVVKDGKTVKFDLDMAPKLRAMRSYADVKGAVPKRSEPAGFWGDFRNCDTPLWAFDDAIDRIAESHRDIDVVYYIGDTIDHFVWETTYESINELNRYVMDKMRQSFGENVPILPVIGNHESQPTNQFAPSSVKGEKVNSTWLYEALALKWSYYLPTESLDTFKQMGVYSLLLRPGLRIIALNTNIAYRYNWWLVFDPLDAKKHLDWLVAELYKAEQAGESVHILSHIPPGVNDLTHTWTREYNRIINRFSPIIKAEFNGHTHSDEFKLFYNTDGEPNHVAWGAGSVTSYSFYNLNYKIAHFDGQKYELQGITNYIYNLTEANLTPNRRPHWFQLYDLKNTFNLPDLSPASIHRLVYNMVTTEKHYLDIYAAFFSKLSEFRMSWCFDECKLNMVCNIVVSVLWERERCEELRRLFYVNRKH